ncbi:MAG: efflux RND transporter periplasmic adaptor subunit, partial [Verrucomicrobiia bacterium]
IVAPFQGIVGLRNISVGALIQPGDLITTLDDDSVMKLDFSVPSHFLSVLSEGLQLEARTSAYPEKTFVGTVQSVSSRVDPVTRAITVRARIDNREGLLKPGLLMLIELTKDRRTAILIPESAILPVSKDAYVFILDDSGEDPVARRKQVVLGARQPGEVEIVEGLQGDERVIVDGGFKLAEGATVRVVAALDSNERPDGCCSRISQ